MVPASISSIDFNFKKGFNYFLLQKKILSEGKEKTQKPTQPLRIF